MTKTKNKNKTIDVLQHLRASLMDLDARNHLLQYPRSRQDQEHLCLTAKMPDQLVARLLAGTNMRFLAVPEPDPDVLPDQQNPPGQPDARKWAMHLGLAPNWAMHLGLAPNWASPWDLDRVELAVNALENACDSNLESELLVPAMAGDEDSAIQSLHFPREMDRHLHTLAQAAASTMEENSANSLYMAFGFLDWSAAEGEKNSLAPLLLLPVLLQQSAEQQYMVKASGEDALANPLLWEKLRQDFALTLPEPDDSLHPEHYFRELIALITAKQPEWTVRPWIALSLFHPHDLLLYHDLAPERWPGKKAISKHPLIKSLLLHYEEDKPVQELVEEQGASSEMLTPAAEANILPLIEAVNGDQSRVLAAALAGTSLVLEGPPGTGKSYSIANLITLALAKNKKVLFVAKKRAALEWVSQYLQQNRLGTFCLELHSEKLAYEQVVKAIQTRLEWRAQCRSQEEINTELALYAEEQAKLCHYAELMGQNWRNTGETLRHIFASAFRYQTEFFLYFPKHTLPLTDLYPFDQDGTMLDADRRLLLKRVLTAFVENYENIISRLPSHTSLEQHPWYGLNYSGPDPLIVSKIQQQIAIWQQSLHSLRQEYHQTLKRLGRSTRQATDSFAAITALQQELALVPQLQGDELLELVPKFRGELLKKGQDCARFFAKILANFADLAKILPASVLRNLEAVPDYAKGCKNLLQLVAKHHSLLTLKRGMGSLANLQQELAELRILMQEISQSMGEGTELYLLVTEEGLADFRDTILLAAMLPKPCWPMRHPRFDQNELDNLLSCLNDDLRGLFLLQESLQGHFCLERLPDKQELRSLRVRLEQGGLLRHMRSTWQRDRKLLLSLTLDSEQVEYETIFALLPRAEEFVVKRQELLSNWKYQELLGLHMQGLETDTQTLALLRSWYQAIRNRFGRGVAPKAELGRILLNLPAAGMEDLLLLHEYGIPQKIEALLEALGQLKKVFPPLASLQSTDMLLHEGKGSIAFFIRSLLRAVQACHPITVNPAMSIADLHKVSGRLLSLREAVTVWEKNDPNQRLFQGHLSLQIRIGAQNKSALAVLDNTLNLAVYLEDDSRDPAIRRYLRRHLATGFVELQACATQLNAALQAEGKNFEAFQQTAELDSETWLQGTAGCLRQIQSRNTRALRGIDELQAWLDYAHCRNQAVQAGLTWLPPALEQQRLTPEQALAAHQAGLYDLLKQEILAEFPDLTPFANVEQNILAQEQARYTERQKALQYEHIAWQIDQMPIPEGRQASARNEQATEEQRTELAFLRFACEKGSSSLILRHLIRRAGSALQALHPCWLMSPAAVAQYLEPGKLRFDLVIVDEASQIRLVSSLGAIARGAQLVVSGDSQQLLPRPSCIPLTAVDEASSPGNEAQVSLLAAAAAALPVYRLHYHYRS